MSDPSPEVSVVASYTFAEAEERAFTLESILRTYGISIRPGSRFEEATLSVVQAMRRLNNPDVLPRTADIRELYQHMTGLTELSSLLISAQSHVDFAQVVPHLRLLNEGSSLQNTPSSGQDQATNKLFELLIALVVMKAGGVDVRLDHPIQSEGDNPDVLATFEGRRWGFPCKVLHGTHPEGLIGHLERGLQQLADSEAEVGVVCFNLKNVVKHDTYWRITNLEAWRKGAEIELSCFIDPNWPHHVLRAETNGLAHALRDYLPPGYLEKVLDPSKSVPGFMFYANVTSGIFIESTPVPASIGVFSLQAVCEPTDDDRRPLDLLHNALKDVNELRA